MFEVPYCILSVLYFEVSKSSKTIHGLTLFIQEQVFSEE